MENVEITKIAGENGANYFFSEVKGSTAVEVKFSDGTSNKYAGDKTLNIGDIFVVGPGCKSSYAIGTVTKIATSAGKTGYLAESVMTFKKDPKKSDIKKCFDAIRPIEALKDFDDLTPSSSFVFWAADEVMITDILVSNILKALTVLTYPELASERMLDEAKQYLSKKKSMPAVMFGSEMNEKFGDECVLMGFSGYYPGWRDELRGLSIWADDATNTEDDYLEEINGLPVYIFTGRDAIKKAFSENAEFNAFCNRLVYLSAFAVMIRGNMDNLLKTALSVSMPISDFYTDIVHLAEALEQETCLKLLQATDYPNLKFESATSEIAKVAAKPKSVPGFVVDDQILTKYEGNDEIVTIPEGIKIIGAFAFYRNKTVKKIIMPNTVTQIKSHAMEFCSELQEVVLGNNVSSFGNSCFASCELLVSIDFSNTKVKTMPKEILCNCRSLKTLDLSKTKITAIKESAFYNCRFETIILPPKLQSIDVHAFGGVVINEIIIPATVRDIASSAFEGVLYEHSQIGRMVFESSEPINFCVKDVRYDCVIACKKESDLMKMFVKQNADLVKDLEHYTEKYGEPSDFFEIGAYIPRILEEL